MTSQVHFRPACLSKPAVSGVNATTGLPQPVTFLPPQASSMSMLLRISALLLLRRIVCRQIVLRIGMRGDVEAGLDDLLDRVGIKLGAARVDEERRRNAEPLERMHQPPHADAAAVGGPGLGGMIDGALLQMRGLHRIARRAVVRPGLEHHRHRDGDLLAVRPGQRSSVSCSSSCSPSFARSQSDLIHLRNAHGRDQLPPFLGVVGHERDELGVRLEVDRQAELGELVLERRLPARPPQARG